VNLALSLAVDRRWPEAREEYRRAVATTPESDVVKSRLRDLDRLISSNEQPARKEEGATGTKAIQVSSRSEAAATASGTLEAAAPDARNDVPVNTKTVHVPPPAVAFLPPPRPVDRGRPAMQNEAPAESKTAQVSAARTTSRPPPRPVDVGRIALQKQAAMDGKTVRVSAPSAVYTPPPRAPRSDQTSRKPVRIPDLPALDAPVLPPAN
jgi:hypothetical protein